MKLFSQFSKNFTMDFLKPSLGIEVGIILIIQVIDSDSGESYAANAFAIWIWRREKSRLHIRSLKKLHMNHVHTWVLCSRCKKLCIPLNNLELLFVCIYISKV
ncbi:hypothetical protein V6Z12_D08G177500 [Gossypium hirsutum]